jgi:hypothetical protein
MNLEKSYIHKRPNTLPPFDDLFAELSDSLTDSDGVTARTGTSHSGASQSTPSVHPKKWDFQWGLPVTVQASAPKEGRDSRPASSTASTSQSKVSPLKRTRVFEQDEDGGFARYKKLKGKSLAAEFPNYKRNQIVRLVALNWQHLEQTEKDKFIYGNPDRL